MPLNFPSNPQDGDLYENYVYDATPGVWRFNADGQTLNNQIADLEAFDNNFDLYDPADGQALVYNSVGGKWVPGNAAPSGVKELTSDNINIDFSDNIPLESRAVTSDVTFTASGYTPGAKKTVYLTGDTVARNLTFPATWNFITDKPTAIGASKKNILDLNSFGTSESTTVALWLGASAFEPISATGGTMSIIDVNGVSYQVHEFTNTGFFEVSSVGDSPEVQYLLVGGGGGGGNDHGGGGGAGGFLTGTANVIANTYTATVGLGGQGGPSVRDNVTLGTSGGDSSLFGYTALGGGRGGSYTNGSPDPGGSGGGGGGDGDAGGASLNGQGNAGGAGYAGAPSYQGGGGGGAGSAGLIGTASVSSPHGGDGFPSSITGSTVVYAGGGGGCSAYDGTSYGLGGSGGGGRGATNTAVAVSGVNGLGGGGGGANRHAAGGTHAASSIGTAGNGGSGIVIIRYPITDPN